MSDNNNNEINKMDGGVDLNQIKQGIGYGIGNMTNTLRNAAATTKGVLGNAVSKTSTALGTAASTTKGVVGNAASTTSSAFGNIFSSSNNITADITIKNDDTVDVKSIDFISPDGGNTYTIGKIEDKQQQPASLYIKGDELKTQPIFQDISGTIKPSSQKSKTAAIQKYVENNTVVDAAVETPETPAADANPNPNTAVPETPAADANPNPNTAVPETSNEGGKRRYSRKMQNGGKVMKNKSKKNMKNTKIL